MRTETAVAGCINQQHRSGAWLVANGDSSCSACAASAYLADCFCCSTTFSPGVLGLLALRGCMSTAATHILGKPFILTARYAQKGPPMTQGKCTLPKNTCGKRSRLLCDEGKSATDFSSLLRRRLPACGDVPTAQSADNRASYCTPNPHATVTITYTSSSSDSLDLSDSSVVRSDPSVPSVSDRPDAVPV